MKYFLCGNTGSVNRGCEAIVRSTVKVLEKRNGDIYLATFAPEQDKKMVSQLGINVLPYASYPTKIHRYFFGLLRKIFKNSLFGLSIIQKPIFSRISQEDISLNIGGDTYCYARPIYSLALNKYTHKKGIKNILWCCSVEKSKINKEILKDLNRYTYIFAREQITVQNLIEAGVDNKKIVKVCDPAFFLDTKQTTLPEGFVAGNTVGINVSEMVINEGNPFVYENVISTIKYILENTDMNVCLIPHVYNIKNNSNDYPILKKIFNEINSQRVSFVDIELDCEQLKYIISKCRFFIGARTHSTIAAYSSGVPTLVLGYSVKSKGIAKDLFGTYEDYVLPYGSLTKANELLSAFKKLVENEEDIKALYNKVLPEYKNQLTTAIQKYIPKQKSEKPFSICEKEICSGCSACAQACPQNAITMTCDEQGFLYPSIDFEKCTNCGICRKLCPCANKNEDDGKNPETYYVINNNQDIRLNSSSGGVFTALAESILENKGVVFGAAFDDEFNVVHKACQTIDELASLRGSKYVESKIGDSYKQAKELLEKGIKVLFTGTPCQIGGLYAYLKKDYDNLYTADFICHGVPSPAVWREYIKLREQRTNSKIKRISFRNKSSGWQRYSVYFEFENGTEYKKVLTGDPYMRGFLAHLYLRPSCSICSFKQKHRKSDITLADFWGVEKIKPEINDDKGISLVMIHSDNGKKLFNAVENKLTFSQTDFDKAIKENTSYYCSSKASPLSKNFYKKFGKMDFKKIIERYLGCGILAKLRRAKAKFF